MSFLFSSFISLKQQSGDLSQNFAENQQTAVKLMNFKTEELVTIYQSALSKEKLESAKHSNQLQQINWTGQEDKMKTNSLSFSDCKSINWPLAQHPTPPHPTPSCWRWCFEIEAVKHVQQQDNYPQWLPSPTLIQLSKPFLAQCHSLCLPQNGCKRGSVHGLASARLSLETGPGCQLVAGPWGLPQSSNAWVQSVGNDNPEDVMHHGHESVATKHSSSSPWHWATFTFPDDLSALCMHLVIT